MILLSFPRYQAELAEAQAKLLQPDLLRAQLTKAENEATASKLQPEMTKTQLARAKNEAEASEMQPDLISLQVNKARLDATIAEYAALAAHYQPHMAEAQLEKAKNDAKASAVQPELVTTQLEKTKLETINAVFQPKLSQLQLVKLGIDTKIAGASLPLAEQGIAMSRDLMSAMAPMMTAMSGMMSGLYGGKSNSVTSANTTSETTAVEHSEDYNNGLAWRDKWDAYVESLSGDQLEGAQFWARVRSEKRNHTCNEERGAASEDFRKGCRGAVNILTSVDKWNKPNTDFHEGWNRR
jgi:hypothetical protein